MRQYSELRLKVSKIDLKLLSAIFSLNFIGIVLLYSAGNDYEQWHLKQLTTLMIFMPLYLVIVFTDISYFYRNAYLIYGIFLFLVVLSLIVGHKAMGAQRWLRIGPINIQPSELMKIGVMLAIARYFHDMQLRLILKPRYLVVPLLLALIPILLILKQPNLGTAIITIAIVGAMFFTAGIRVWNFVVTIAMATLSLPVVWSVLHDYQKKRVLTFLNPENDPLGAGYNIIQSIIAIGSGGLAGTGLGQGPQNQLDFLPEKQTDFIFTILAEEYGFIGIAIVFSISIFIYIYGLFISWLLKNQFARLLCVGVFSMFTVHIIINTAMISGLIPVVGVPFPLLSYGGSNQISMMLGFSLVFSAMCSTSREIR